MGKRPREAGGGGGGRGQGHGYNGIGAAVPGVPLAEAGANPLLILMLVQQQAAQIQQLIALNQQQSAQLQQQAQAMEQQSAHHAAQLQRQSEQISVLLSSIGSAAVNHPLPSVEEVVEGLRRANAVTNTADGTTALHEYACAGYIAGIKALLSAGAHPNVSDRHGNTSLHTAAMHNHGEAVRLLVAAGGANLEGRNMCRETPLLAAVDSFNDNYKSAQALIEAGANVNVRSRDGDEDNRRSALHIAVFRKNIGCVKALLAAHADVHARDENRATPLHVASEDAPVSIIELLLEAGSDIESADRAGMTPLSRAAFCENTSVLSYLISKGANTNAKESDGTTALLRAVVGDKLESVRILLKAGADVTIADNSGLTPIGATVERRRYGEMLQLLLSGGGGEVKREEKVEEQCDL